MRSIKIAFTTDNQTSTSLTIPGYSDELSESMTKMIISDMIGSGALPYRNGNITEASGYNVIETVRKDFDLKSA